MIEALSGFPANIVAIRASGDVSKEDYDTVLVPLAEKAFAAHDRIRVYYEIDAGFAGFEPGAMWEDFKLGMGHITGWEKVALVTDVAWMKHMMDFFGFMMPAEMKTFGLAQAQEAKEWIEAE